MHYPPLAIPFDDVNENGLLAILFDDCKIKRVACHSL